MIQSKRKIISVLLFIFSLSLVGCSNKKHNVNEGIVSNEDIVSVEDEDLTNSLLTFEPTIENVEIVIPGMKSEYHFLFIADNHAIILDDKDSEEVINNALPRIDFFKNGNTGMSCADTFSSWIDYANQLQVDGLLMGGDMIDFPSEANISLLKENISALQVPYLYVLGNHDWTYPWEYFTDTAQTEYRTKFNEYTNDNSSIQTMEYNEFIIVAIDNSMDQISSEVLEAVQQVINMKKPVIIMMHVPLESESLRAKSIEMWGRSISIGNNGIYPNDVTREFMEMIYNEDSPVIAVLAGHVHCSDTSTLNSNMTQYVTDVAYNGYGMLFTIKGDQ